MSCRRSTLKKYSSRPSPAYPAQDCKGQTKTGNDGQLYVSSPTKKGVYRWILASPTRKAKGVKSYQIHDNGGRPFVVEVHSAKKEVEVFLNEYNEDTDKFIKGKSILRSPYQQIFVGPDSCPGRSEYTATDPSFKGNSILLHVSGSKYIYIGSEIHSFETRDGETIKQYYSPVENNDVPYPYAIGENYTYFMLDMETLPNELLNLKKDGYAQFYGFIHKDSEYHDYKYNKPTKEQEAYFKKVVDPAKKGFRHKKIYSRR